MASLQAELQKKVQQEKVHGEEAAAREAEAAALAEVSRQHQVQARASPSLKAYIILVKEPREPVFMHSSRLIWWMCMCKNRVHN